MIQLICNGVEVDVPRGTSIAWKNTNILFAFDKASCERSLTFTLPSTAVNDTVFELCRLPQYVGQGFRRLYDAEYRDGLLVKKGYAYVTQSQKSGYNVTLVVGELTALKRLKDAGKVGEVLPDTDMHVSQSVQDANIAEYTDLQVLRYKQTGIGYSLMPSWCFRPLLVDVLNELQVPFTLPAEAEYLRMTLPELKGSTFVVEVTNTRHTDVEYPTGGADADNKYNTLTITANSAISVQSDVQLIAHSYKNGSLINSYDFYLDGHQGYQTLRDGTYLYGLVDDSYDEDEWHYLSDVYVANKDCKITFPADFPDDIIVKAITNDGYFFARVIQTLPSSQGYVVAHNLVDEAIPTPSSITNQFAFLKTFPLEGAPTSAFDSNTGLADTSWTADCIENRPLAGETIEIPAGTRFILVRREDFACAHDAQNRAWIYDYQPRFNDYNITLTVECDVVDTGTHWDFGKRDNTPDVTAIEMLKTLANVSGTVLYYTEANGISFEDLLLTDFTPIDLTSKLMSIKSLKPLFFDYKKNNFVKYSDDAMTAESKMIKVNYETNSAILTEDNELHVLPFTCVSGSLELGQSQPLNSQPVYYDRIRWINGGGEKPSKYVLSKVTNDIYLNRVPLVKNATIQQLCKEPLTIEATLHMSNYEYSQIQPFSLIHLNGVDYVWTESSWQKNTATLTLSKLPLTLSEPQPTPPPLIYTYYDYLESTAADKQWIDTGVVPNNNTRVICEYFFRSGVNRAFVFGARTSNRVASFLHRGTSGAQSSADYGTNQQVNFGAVTAETRYTIDANKNVWTLTDEQQQTVVRTFTAQTFVANCSLTLFSLNSNGSTNNLKDPSAIISAKIYDNDVLVRDFRPAVRIADGVAGMHDVVNDVFYPSANGVNFLYGNF